MKVQAAICAQGVAVDQLSNRLSLFNILETIQAQSFPVVLPELVFVVLLRREPEEPSQFDTEVQVLLGDLNIGKLSAQVDFKNSLTSRHIINFQPFLVQGPGEMRFLYRLPSGMETVATIPVIQTKPSAPVPAQAQGTGSQSVSSKR